MPPTGGMLYTLNVRPDYTTIRSTSQAKSPETKGPTGVSRGAHMLIPMELTTMLTTWLHTLNAPGAILMPSLSGAAHTFERLCLGISLQNWSKTVNRSVVLWVFLFTHRL